MAKSASKKMSWDDKANMFQNFFTVYTLAYCAMMAVGANKMFGPTPVIPGMDYWPNGVTPSGEWGFRGMAVMMASMMYARWGLGMGQAMWIRMLTMMNLGITVLAAYGAFMMPGEANTMLFKVNIFVHGLFTAFCFKMGRDAPKTKK